jgi:hypothetical protein
MNPAPAPLLSATVVAVLIRRDTTSVMLAVPEEHGHALRTWLWGTDRYHRGRALGARFRLALDGVTVEGYRVTAWASRTSPEMVVCLTGDTTKAKRATALGWRVGQVINEATLTRLDGASDKRQTVIQETRPEGEKRRVTVEVDSAGPAESSETTTTGGTDGHQNK